MYRYFKGDWFCLNSTKQDIVNLILYRLIAMLLEISFRHTRICVSACCSSEKLIVVNNIVHTVAMKHQVIYSIVSKSFVHSECFVQCFSLSLYPCMFRTDNWRAFWRYTHFKRTSSTQMPSDLGLELNKVHCFWFLCTLLKHIRVLSTQYWVRQFSRALAFVRLVSRAHASSFDPSAMAVFETTAMTAC